MKMNILAILGKLVVETQYTPQYNILMIEFQNFILMKFGTFVGN